MPLISRLAALALSFGLSACASADPNWVEVGGERYVVEIADDAEERARGLMFRDTLAEGTGMLFVHEQEEPQAYWMKNTRIALDILYFDDALTLVSQQRDVPPCSGGTSRCWDTSVSASSKYRMSSAMRVFFIQYACGDSRS